MNRVLDWLQLRRSVGVDPSTPLASQEGQLRYDRDGDVNGRIVLGRHKAGGTYEWMEVASATHAHTGSATIFVAQSKDSGFSALTTTLATVDSVSIGPLTSGVTYDLICMVDARLSMDAATSGYARIYARIGGDSSVMGNQTGTEDGERSCHATATKSGVVGDGSTSYTLYARADTDADTGTVSACHIRGIAIPRNV